MKQNKLSYLVTVFIGIILAGFLVLYPLDLYVMKPGHAYNVSEYVNVQNGDQDDEGSFSLMTVSMTKATPLTYIYAKFYLWIRSAKRKKMRKNTMYVN